MNPIFSQFLHYHRRYSVLLGSLFFKWSDRVFSIVTTFFWVNMIKNVNKQTSFLVKREKKFQNLIYKIKEGKLVFLIKKKRYYISTLNYFVVKTFNIALQCFIPKYRLKPFLYTYQFKCQRKCGHGIYLYLDSLQKFLFLHWKGHFYSKFIFICPCFFESSTCFFECVLVLSSEKTQFLCLKM